MGAEATDTRPRLHVGLKAGQWEKPPASLCFCSPVSAHAAPLGRAPQSHLARIPGRAGWAEGNQVGVSVGGCSRVALWEPDLLILQDTPGTCISICCLPIILTPCRSPRGSFI